MRLHQALRKAIAASLSVIMLLLGIGPAHASPAHMLVHADHPVMQRVQATLNAGGWVIDPDDGARLDRSGRTLWVYRVAGAGGPDATASPGEAVRRPFAVLIEEMDGEIEGVTTLFASAGKAQTKIDFEFRSTQAPDVVLRLTDGAEPAEGCGRFDLAISDLRTGETTPLGCLISDAAGECRLQSAAPSPPITPLSARSRCRKDCVDHYLTTLGWMEVVVVAGCLALAGFAALTGVGAVAVLVGCLAACSAGATMGSIVSCIACWVDC